MKHNSGWNTTGRGHYRTILDTMLFNIERRSNYLKWAGLYLR